MSDVAAQVLHYIKVTEENGPALCLFAAVKFLNHAADGLSHYKGDLLIAKIAQQEAREAQELISLALNTLPRSK